jgi:hypothetical protein
MKFKKLNWIFILIILILLLLECVINNVKTNMNTNLYNAENSEQLFIRVTDTSYRSTRKKMRSGFYPLRLWSLEWKVT